MGGSAIVIAQTKAADRPLHLYDVFAMVPAPGDEDDDKSRADYQALVNGVIERAHDRTFQNYQEHMDDLLAFTQENMRRVGIDPEKSRITFVKGLYEDTLLVEEPVAFAHIDCDWYESVRLCMERTASASAASFSSTTTSSMRGVAKPCTNGSAGTSVIASFTPT